MHEIITASTRETAERLEVLDAETGDDEDEVLIPPFVFLVLERVELERRKGEEAAWSEVERFVDGTGEPCNVLRIWRADRDENGLPLGYLDECYRQIEAAGYYRHNRGDGFWEWRLSSADRPQHI